MTELHIIKIGGAVLNNEKLLHSFLDDFARIPESKILVHGGGRKANNLLNALDIDLKMVEGRRITDEATLEIVVMVYAGLLNKNLVAQLAKRDLTAIGLSGADLNLILAKKRAHPFIDFGWVGDIVSVQTAPIINLLSRDVVPVLCAITHNGKGQLLNTNADTIATEMAIAMSDFYTTKLWMTFEKQGVLLAHDDPQSKMDEITFDQYDTMVQNGQIVAGMKPKLENAFRALRRGVAEVRVCPFDTFNDLSKPKGTKIVI
jgi:acetylglutamate kinase